jgi:hypothetical protein
VPGHYSAEVQITRGFWLVSWFKEQFAVLPAIPRSRYEFVIALYEAQKKQTAEAGKLTNVRWTYGNREYGDETCFHAGHREWLRLMTREG